MTRNYNSILHIAKNWKLMIFIFKKLLKQFFDFFMSLSKSFKRKIMRSQLLYSLDIESFELAVDIFYTLFADIKIVI